MIVIIIDEEMTINPLLNLHSTLIANLQGRPAKRSDYKVSFNNGFRGIQRTERICNSRASIDLLELSKNI